MYHSVSVLHFGATWWRNFGNPITSLYVFMENQYYNVKQAMTGINIVHPLQSKNLLQFCYYKNKEFINKKRTNFKPFEFNLFCLTVLSNSPHPTSFPLGLLRESPIKRVRSDFHVVSHTLPPPHPTPLPYTHTLRSTSTYLWYVLCSLCNFLRWLWDAQNQ